MRVVVFGCTLPWQLLAAHPPGPLYIPVATFFCTYNGAVDEEAVFCVSPTAMSTSSGKTAADSSFRILLFSPRKLRFRSYDESIRKCTKSNFVTALVLCMRWFVPHIE